MLVAPRCFGWSRWGEYADSALLDYLFCRFGRILAASLLHLGRTFATAAASEGRRHRRAYSNALAT